MRDLLQRLSPKEREASLAKLNPEQLEWLMKDWKTWGRPDQQMPAPLVMATNKMPWRRWVIMAGRGWGKTRTACEALKEVVDAGRARNIGLIGATAADVRDTMVIGKPEFPALLGVWPEARKPIYIPSRRLVRFWNGAQATTFTAEKPARLRGPQHDFVWGDELPVSQYPQETYDNMVFGLRHREARAILTFTPKRIALVKALLKDPSAIITRGKTWDNAANLSAAFIAELKAKYEGTRLGRQELEGELLEDVAGALWKLAMIEEGRVKEAPDLVRVLIGVDPSVSGRDKADGERQGDECGIVALGRAAGGRRFVLGDYSVNASPDGWARAAVKAYWLHRADVMVAEANNGGEMVRMVIQGIDPRVNVVLVHATRGKYTRAEPCAADYERGDVSHVGIFRELEEEMTSWVPDGKQPSPNRLDALVWAWTYDAEGYASPSVYTT